MLFRLNLSVYFICLLQSHIHRQILYFFSLQGIGTGLWIAKGGVYHSGTGCTMWLYKKILPVHWQVMVTYLVWLFSWRRNLSNDITTSAVAALPQKLQLSETSNAFFSVWYFCSTHSALRGFFPCCCWVKITNLVSFYSYWNDLGGDAICITLAPFYKF